MTRIIDCVFLAAAAALTATFINIALEASLAPRRTAVVGEAPSHRERPLPLINVERLAALTGLHSQEAAAPDVLQPLDARLLGTMIDVDHPEASLATIQSSVTLKVTTSMIGDFISGAEIVSIERSRVFVRAQGQLREIGANASSASAGPRVPDVEIKRADIFAAIAGFAKDPLRPLIAPVIVRGVTRGVRLTLQPGSIYATLGLQTGDVVTRLNGEDLSGWVLQGVEAVSKLRSAATIEVDFERDGTVMHRTFALR